MPDGEQTPSISQEFADAFGEGEPSAAAGKPGEQAKADATPKGEADAKTVATQQAASAEQQQGASEGQDGADDSDDPLSSLTIDALLKHPKLGPALNQWNDKSAKSQVEADRRREREQGRHEGRQQVEEESLVRFIESLSQDELARELAADPQFAIQYAKYQEARQAPAVDAQAIAATSQVYALATQIHSNNELIEKSDLPADVKASLAADNYSQHGDRAIVEWNQAIHKAFVKHEAARIASGNNDEDWEASKQERLAELDRNRPGGLAAAGRAAAPKPDLMKTPTGKLFADAFSS